MWGTEVTPCDSRMSHHQLELSVLQTQTKGGEVYWCRLYTSELNVTEPCFNKMIHCLKAQSSRWGSVFVCVRARACACTSCLVPVKSSMSVNVCWHHFFIFFWRSRNFCLLSVGISSRLIPWLLALRDRQVETGWIDRQAGWRNGDWMETVDTETDRMWRQLTD